ncbi:MAG: cisplatin damage response ATP-dependent DNA ligase [Alphaproteobacteria bacterium]|nr:cisplatin damage response ATP-dependent DNA ligase [Alphaproteobacteria bacterium]
MKAFSRLLAGLLYTPARNSKLRLLRAYLAETPDPDRGYALAALTGTLAFAEAKPAAVREVARRRVDPVLFDLSYDYVGDLAETVALIWPTSGGMRDLRLGEVVDTLTLAARAKVPELLEGWLDRLDAEARWALIKLLTGGLRVGVSERLAKAALAEHGKVELAQVEEIWHGLDPPYRTLFDWLDRKAPPPQIDAGRLFRPLMLAHAIEEHELFALDPRDFRAEWKWDGIRVQIVSGPNGTRLFSRGGEEVGTAFPDLVERMAFPGVVDGELLVRRGEGVAPFNDLQQRLNRKKASARHIVDYPAFVRVYDLLFEGEEDLRHLGFDARRARLETWVGKTGLATGVIDLSPLVPFADWEELGRHRLSAGALNAEGLMLKRADSPYVSGRPKGFWFKWKRAADTIDAVLMYAQRGHGKRSSFYSDYTFGLWTEPGGELVPVGKAYFGFTDAELAELDKWVRNHTVDRFGPVRQVEAGLVLEIAFDSAQRSTRHKSGVALRFPRVARIRWDKPAGEADVLETLVKRIPA